MQCSLTLTNSVAHESYDLPHHRLRYVLLLDGAEIGDFQHVERQRIVRLAILSFYLLFDTAAARVDVIIQVVLFEVCHDDVALLALHGVGILLLAHDRGG